ncbi:MAG: 50S ribosomal protein L4 [Saccharofermentanales bacterium]|jgi:large subunit ribosomal protein L4|nr:50S ribosomal protein L4 [Bacillota bacterium]NLB09121.1 50S ribosomal protein L4 [Clostridiales bacterium]
MAKIDIYNMDGKIVGDLELADEIFAIEPHQDVMHRVLVNQHANRRQGTVKVKGRSEVRGGGKKPYRQKGTGRARHGSIRSAQYVGGGRIFGPAPRNFRYSLPRKMRRLALKSALASKFQADKMLVLDELKLDEIKTKKMVKILNNLGVDGSALIVLPQRDLVVERSANNLRGIKISEVQTLNVTELLKFDRLILTKEAVSRVEEVYN